MIGKYVLHCDHDEPKIEEFIDVVKQHNRDYAILYSKQDSGDSVITLNEIIFEDYDEFLEHLEGTSGGYDGTFGYRK